MVIFAAVTLLNLLRRSYFKGVLQVMLIAVFAIKSCDLLIDYYSAHNKSVAVENVADEDTSNDVSEDCFEKIDKKLYSNFEHNFSFISVTWINPLPILISVYSFSIFKEPLRVVLTPPPNLG